MKNINPMKALISILVFLAACTGDKTPTLECGNYGEETITCRRWEKELLKTFNDERQQAFEIKELRKELADALHAQFVCESKLGKQP